MTSSERLERFQVAYTRVLNHVVVHGRLDNAHDDRVAQALKSVYEEMARGKNGDDVLSAKDLPQISRSECLLVMAMDLLGNACWNEGRPEEALHCFKLAHAYYILKFDRTFVKPREVKRKMVKILLDANRYADVVKELKDEVEFESYGSAVDTEISLYFKYAYGRALVATGSKMEAIPYLSHKQLGQMDFHKKGNYEVLVSTIKVIMEQIALDQVSFSIDVTGRLIGTFMCSMIQQNCPSQIYDLVSSVACHLASKGLMAEYHKMYQVAHSINACLKNQDSLLLVSVIGCSFPSDSEVFRICMDNIVHIHEKFLALVKKDSWFILSRLKVTAKHIYVCEKKSRAVQVLLDTFNKISDILRVDNPYYSFFFQTANDRLWAAD
ncbi:uncharacterized protein LOC124165718 [Ischnura elegans]|uniref:uncharacterized protein LOC124165718 n=1 Tax=Ischnura elegans TaxID=197161 RepID=UPI001ED8AC56|nr:uncharacterized protein LOC124165718 [Ischnura elegans]XP_046399161.1 uncharacterized protein LOC124165718 [Ischnura elegans]